LVGESNLASNVAAGLGGALVGGTAGAATGSNVELYNERLDPLHNGLLAKVCNGSAPCSPSLMAAAVNADAANSQAVLNMPANAQSSLPEVTLTAGVGGTLVLGYGISGGVGAYFTPGGGKTSFDFGFYVTYGTGYGFDPSAGGSVGYNKGGSDALRGPSANVNTAVALADVGVGGTVAYSGGQYSGASFGIGIKGVPSVAGGTASVTNTTTCTVGFSNLKNGISQAFCK
jgi:filamentous hemagglutinin